MENIKVNSEMITLARTSRGLSQKELAELLEIKQGTLSKIESGLQGVSDELKTKLSQVLSYPESFFQQQEKIENFTVYHYRKKLQLPKKELERSEAHMKIGVLNIEKLLTDIELPETKLPEFDSSIESPAEYAKALRKNWEIPSGRIINLTKLAEDHGILIVNMDFESNQIDGLGILTENKTAIIFMNRNVPSDRYRLTLAHEIGHLILHVGKQISEDRDVEKEAYFFGGELLMPEDDIKQHLVKLDLEKLADLKRYWKVSMAALIMRAKVLGALTQDQYEYLWRKMNKEGYRKREPEALDFPKEEPTLLKEILEAYLRDEKLNYTEEELASYLSLTSEEFNQKYFTSKPRLKITR